MNSLATNFPAPRVVPNQRNAFVGIWRLTWSRFLTPGHGLALLGSLAVLALLAGAARPGAPDGHYLRWIGNFYVVFIVPILAFISAGGAIRDDVKAGSVDYILTRPVQRPAFVGFRFVAHVLCAQIDFLFALGLLVGLGVSLHAPGIVSAVPELVLAQGMMVVAFSAFGFLCGAATSRYIIVGICYAGVVEVGVGNIPTQLSRLSMTHQALGLLHGPARDSASTGMGAISTVALLLAFSVLMLGAAMGIFSFREWASSQAREA